jgi:hypothetical protein
MTDTASAAINFSLYREYMKKFFPLISSIIIYFNCKWGFTWWQWYCNKSQYTVNAHHTHVRFEEST